MLWCYDSCYGLFSTFRQDISDWRCLEKRSAAVSEGFALGSEAAVRTGQASCPRPWLIIHFGSWCLSLEVGDQGCLSERPLIHNHAASVWIIASMMVYMSREAVSFREKDNQPCLACPTTPPSTTHLQVRKGNPGKGDPKRLPKSASYMDSGPG